MSCIHSIMIIHNLLCYETTHSGATNKKGAMILLPNWHHTLWSQRLQTKTSKIVSKKVRMSKYWRRWISNTTSPAWVCSVFQRRQYLGNCSQCMIVDNRIFRSRACRPAGRLVDMVERESGSGGFVNNPVREATQVCYAVVIEVIDRHAQERTASLAVVQAVAGHRSWSLVNVSDSHVWGCKGIDQRESDC